MLKFIGETAEHVDLDRLRTKMLFLGLTDAQLQAVSGIASLRSFRRGEVIQRRGALDDALYVIEEGSVELRVTTAQGERMVAVFERGSYVDEGFAGDFFGEFSLVDLEPWPASVLARERTVVLEFKRDDLYEVFSRDIDLQIGMILNIARGLCRRLRLRNRG